MGKLSEMFSMSKQERVGAWAIAALIVVLLAVVFIEHKCSSDNTTDAKAQKELNEYVNKTDDIKVTEKKKKAKTNSSKSKTKAKSASAKKDGSKTSAKTAKKDSDKSAAKKDSSKSTAKKNSGKANQSTKKKTSQTSKKTAPKKKVSGANRLMEPVPQF